MNALWIHMYMNSCIWIQIWIHVYEFIYEFIWFFHIRIQMFYEFIFEFGCIKVPDDSSRAGCGSPGKVLRSSVSHASNSLATPSPPPRPGLSSRMARARPHRATCEPRRRRLGPGWAAGWRALDVIERPRRRRLGPGWAAAGIMGAGLLSFSNSWPRRLHPGPGRPAGPGPEND